MSTLYQVNKIKEILIRFLETIIINGMNSFSSTVYGQNAERSNTPTLIDPSSKETANVCPISKNLFQSYPKGSYRNSQRLTSRNGLDRFIPMTSNKDTISLGRHSSLSRNSVNKTKNASETYQQLLEYALEVERDDNVFTYAKLQKSDMTQKCPTMVPSEKDNKGKLNEKKNRSPENLLPFRILDAPELRDDFYTSLLSWSPKGDLAIGLAENIYLWSKELGPTRVLEESIYDVSSVAYSYNGDILAVGRVDGTLQFWRDNERVPRISIHHPGDIGVLAWKPVLETNRLLVGKGNGNIFVYDIIWSESTSKAVLVATITNAHDEQVCGLTWNHDGSQFASGGNDNRVCLFKGSDLRQPLYVWQQNAAVKALSFCPWQRSLLATGAGSHDKHIRFYNCFNGKKIDELYCGAQITSIHWSPKYREFSVTFGYSLETVQHRFAVYSWPQLECLVSVLPSVPDIRCVHSVLTSQLNETTGRCEMTDSIIIASSNETIKFFDLSEESSWHNSRVLTWHGIFDSQILEMLEGIDGKIDSHLR